MGFLKERRGSGWRECVRDQEVSVTIEVMELLCREANYLCIQGWRGE